MLNKVIHLDPYFPTGEPTVQPAVLWSRGKKCIEPLSKHASVASDYFQTVEPIPGHSIVYVLAVSSWEFYGENRNGDGFPEYPFKPLASPPWIAEDQVLTRHYKSFETYGYNYRHHVNNDPAKSVGRVLKAFWNPTMHRVELAVQIDNSKAPDLIQRIEAGEFPPVSMGTRVPYDVCNICGNRAPTRAQYCEHLRFQMRDVVDGVKVAALNPNPKFFDISWVVRPADPTAYMLKKVADEIYEVKLSGAAAGEYIDEMQERKLAAHKLAVIDKIVDGVTVDAKDSNVDPVHLRNLVNMRGHALDMSNRLPELSDGILRRLAQQFTLPQIFTSTLVSGMPLCSREVIKITIYKKLPQMQNVDLIADAAASARGPILELFSQYPQFLDTHEEDLNIDASNVVPKVAEVIGNAMEKRSGIYDYLRRRFVPDKYRDEYAYSTPYSITDPTSNQRWGTTRGAAIKAHDEIAKRNTYKIVGGAASLAGAYGLISAGLRSRGLGKLRPLVAGTLGITGLSNLPSMGAHYMTDQGIPVPVLTEMTKMSSAASSLALPLFGTLGIMAILGMDRKRRVAQGYVPGDPYAGTFRRGVDAVGTFAKSNPVIATALGTAGLATAARSAPGRYVQEQIARPAVQKGQLLWERTVHPAIKRWSEKADIDLKAWGKAQVKTSADTVILPDADMDKLAESLGEALFEALLV